MDNGDTLGRTYVNDIHRHFGAGASEPIVKARRRSVR